MIPKLRAISFSDGLDGVISKSTLVLWGEEADRNASIPLVYMHRPKYLSDDDWVAVRIALRDAITGLRLVQASQEANP